MPIPERRSLLLLGLPVLCLGLTLGIVLNSVFFAAPAKAQSRNPDRKRMFGAPGEDALLNSSRLLSRIASRTTPSVVHIQSQHRDARGRNVEETGSGVLIRSPRANGVFVVTNNHVIRGAEFENISVHLSDGLLVNPTNVLEDKNTDIAVLEIPSTDLPAARWGNSDEVDIGHIVLAMGSPFGLSQSVTLGIISAKGRRDLQLDPSSSVINQDFLQTDAAINPGNSGGPLIDLRGEIVGINTAIASNSGGNEGIGFSIPSNLVRRVVDHLLYYGKVRRAYLGVQLDPEFSLDNAKRLGLDRITGARVVLLYPQTPASRADLRLDDVILRFGDIDVSDENHLINLVSMAEVDSRVKLLVLRNNRRILIDVSLSERPSKSRVSAKPKAKTERLSARPMSQQIQRPLIRKIGLQTFAGGLLITRPGNGLMPYDVLDSINGRPIQSLHDLPTGEDEVLLKVRRYESGQNQTHEIRLSCKPTGVAI